MANSLQQTPSRRSILRLFDGSRPRAMSPESVECGESFMNQHVSRRALVASSAAATIALSEVAEAGRGESPAERVHRLARELSQALADSVAADEIIAPEMVSVFPATKAYPIAFHLVEGYSWKTQRMWQYEVAHLAKKADPSEQNKYAAKLAHRRLQHCFEAFARD